MRRRRVRRNAVAKQDTAKLKETVTVTVGAGGPVFFDAWGLGDLLLERAPAVAVNFQYYRIKQIELKLITQSDTYSGLSGITMPQVYYLLNKGQSIPTGLGFDEMLDMGAKPRVLNESNLNWKFAPSIVIAERDTTGALVATYPKVHPWLNTNQTPGPTFTLSQVEHAGFIIGVTKMNAGDTTQYALQATYHFEFKDPLIKGASGDVAFVPSA